MGRSRLQSLLPVRRSLPNCQLEQTGRLLVKWTVHCSSMTLLGLPVHMAPEQQELSVVVSLLVALPVLGAAAQLTDCRRSHPMRRLCRQRMMPPLLEVPGKATAPALAEHWLLAVEPPC